MLIWNYSKKEYQMAYVLQVDSEGARYKVWVMVHCWKERTKISSLTL